jgi:hypothetical protein
MGSRRRLATGMLRPAPPRKTDNKMSAVPSPSGEAGASSSSIFQEGISPLSVGHDEHPRARERLGHAFHFAMPERLLCCGEPGLLQWLAPLQLTRGKEGGHQYPLTQQPQAQDPHPSRTRGAPHSTNATERSSRLLSPMPRASACPGTAPFVPAAQPCGSCCERCAWEAAPAHGVMWRASLPRLRAYIR